jgi:SAM-dependent methyltransferase
MFDYDAELQRYHGHLLAALDLHAGEHVLDIGCGTGQTTREAARVIGSGTAVGIDISAPMLARARELSRQAGLHNVAFVEADAQSHRFPDDHFDVAVSRFGTMFFAAPAAAFTNIARALRLGGRFVQLVWQDGGRQEWCAVLDEVFGGGHVPAPTANPFSLADLDHTRALLAGAGLAEVEVTGVDEPLWYGPDATSARNAMLALQGPRDRLAQLDAEHSEVALGRLHAALAARCTPDGVFLDAHAWLISARRS